jgi:putative transposase
MSKTSHLPRLDACNYLGCAWVHWTMTLKDRATGWLDSVMHRDVRELLLHTLARHHLHCAAYCLMPDHAHFVWMGLGARSDQLAAARFFRRHWNEKLRARGVTLQTQAYDHVLRVDERQPNAFEDAVLYVFHNPARANLVKEWQDWPYLGAVAPGFPQLPVVPIGEFWPRFWRIHNRERTRVAGGEIIGES